MDSTGNYVVKLGDSVVSRHQGLEQAVRDAAHRLRSTIEAGIGDTVQVQDRAGRLVWRERGVRTRL